MTLPSNFHFPILYEENAVYSPERIVSMIHYALLLVGLLVGMVCPLNRQVRSFMNKDLISIDMESFIKYKSLLTCNYHLIGSM